MRKKMDSELAEKLADCLITQFEEMPLAVERMPLREYREQIVKMIKEVQISESKTRAQFPFKKNPLPKLLEPLLPEFLTKDPSKLEYIPAGHLIQSFRLRRIIANYETSYSPGYIISAWRDFKSYLHKNPQNLVFKSTFDAQLVGRLVRLDEEIADIRKRSLEAGNPFSLLGHLEARLHTCEKQGGGDIPGYIHIPLIFIPGAKPEDYLTLARFCVAHQKPGHEKIRSFQTHGIFKAPVYKLYETRKRKEESRLHL